MSELVKQIFAASQEPVRISFAGNWKATICSEQPPPTSAIVSSKKNRFHTD